MVQGTAGTSSQQLWGSELRITFLGEHRQGAEAATQVMEYWQAIQQHLVLDQFYLCHLWPWAWLSALDLILHLSQKCCE